jgi:beta-glucanase (GH16 family)
MTYMRKLRRRIMKISDFIGFANKDQEYYDPKLLLTDEEIEEIEDRNKGNKDVQSLLNDLETYKKIVMRYESL